MSIDGKDRECLLCHRMDSKGLKIREKFICTKCELQMMELDVGMKKYHWLVSQLKLLWLN
jgi:Inhibitor of sigma-G Gin